MEGQRSVPKKRYALAEDATVREGASPRLTNEPGHILRLCLSLGGDFFEWCADDGTAHTREAKSGTEAVLPQVAANNTEARKVVGAFERTSFWSASKLLLDKRIWGSQELGPSQQLLPDGSNLFSVLYSMKTERRELYEEFVETIRVAFPEFQSIEFPLVGKGFAGLDWHQRGLSRPLDARQLSDGTLRLLWLITILFTVADDGLVLIDEPETSLHPQWLMVLVSLMRQTSARTQIIVATHSDQLIHWLEPHELLVADLEEGVASFRWGSDMDLGEWLKKYRLDELWLMGELGGRQ